VSIKEDRREVSSKENRREVSRKENQRSEHQRGSKRSEQQRESKSTTGQVVFVLSISRGWLVYVDLPLDLKSDVYCSIRDSHRNIERR
jgi:hypothetical protein